MEVRILELGNAAMHLCVIFDRSACTAVYASPTILDPATPRAMRSTFSR